MQPAEPEGVDVDGIVRGIHRICVARATDRARPAARVRCRCAVGPRGPAAARGDDWGVQADVWSVTSWTELRRDGLAADEHNFLHPEQEPRTAYLTREADGTPQARSSR